MVKDQRLHKVTLPSGVEGKICTSAENTFILTKVKRSIKI